MFFFSAEKLTLFKEKRTKSTEIIGFEAGSDNSCHLTEPESGITNSIKYALQKFGIEENDRQKLRLCIGPPLIDSFEQQWGFSRECAKQALVYYRECFADKGIFENEVYDGMDALLSRLSKAGHTLILATSKPEEYAARILDHFGLLDYFTLVAGNTLKEERPTKEDVLCYIKQLYPDLSADNAIMIGDRMYDVQGAHHLSLSCIGVLYGHGSREELESAGADFIVESVAELEKMIMEIAK